MSKCGECKLGCFMEGVLYCEESLGEEQCVARLQEALYELSDRLREEYNRGYCDAVQGIADEMVKQGKYIAQGRPQGEWIPMRVSSGRDSWKCSVCGRRARGKLENLPYCHCGARMRPQLQGKHFDSIIIDECAMKGTEDDKR